MRSLKILVTGILLSFVIATCEQTEVESPFEDTKVIISIEEDQEIFDLMGNFNRTSSRGRSSFNFNSTEIGELNLDYIIKTHVDPNRSGAHYSIPILNSESTLKEWLVLEPTPTGYVGYIMKIESKNSKFRLDQLTGHLQFLDLERNLQASSYYEEGVQNIETESESARTENSLTLPACCDCTYIYEDGHTYNKVGGDNYGGDQPPSSTHGDIVAINCDCGSEHCNSGGGSLGGDSGDGGIGTPINEGSGSTGDGSGSGSGGTIGLGEDSCGTGDLTDPDGDCNTLDDCDTAKDDLKKAFPDASDSVLESLVQELNKYGSDFGIDTKEEMQHFLAQARHESTNYAGKEFGAFEENLNYRWANLGKSDYWQKYFNTTDDPDADSDKADPNDYKRSTTSNFVDAEKFANYVYDRKSLGNTNQGDGYKYRGRGLFQLTGKANYKDFNTFYRQKFDSSKDLVANPDLVASDMKIAVISALWYFQNRVMNKVSINGNTSVKKITKLVNGGDKGLDHRKELFNSTKTNIDCI